MAFWRATTTIISSISAPLYLTCKNMAIAFNDYTNLFTLKVKVQMDKKREKKKKQLHLILNKPFNSSRSFLRSSSSSSSSSSFSSCRRSLPSSYKTETTMKMKVFGDFPKKLSLRISLNDCSYCIVMYERIKRILFTCI